jgi:hypothetical protein
MAENAESAMKRPGPAAPKRFRSGEVEIILNQPQAPPGNGRGIPAVSIRQPQAAALMVQPGPYRRPGWRTDYRGPLLIHAARRMAGDPPADRSDGAAYGALLGIVELVDCMAESGADGGADEAGFIWVLADPRPFASPVPFVGRMGLFDVAHAVVADALASMPSKPRSRKTE